MNAPGLYDELPKLLLSFTKNLRQKMLIISYLIQFVIIMISGNFIFNFIVLPPIIMFMAIFLSNDERRITGALSYFGSFLVVSILALFTIAFAQTNEMSTISTLVIAVIGAFSLYLVTGQSIYDALVFAERELDERAFEIIRLKIPLIILTPLGFLLLLFFPVAAQNPISHLLISVIGYIFQVPILGFCLKAYGCLAALSMVYSMIFHGLIITVWATSCTMKRSETKSESIVDVDKDKSDNSQVDTKNNFQNPKVQFENKSDRYSNREIPANDVLVNKIDGLFLQIRIFWFNRCLKYIEKDSLESGFKIINTNLEGIAEDAIRAYQIWVAGLIFEMPEILSKNSRSVSAEVAKKMLGTNKSNATWKYLLSYSKTEEPGKSCTGKELLRFSSDLFRHFTNRPMDLNCMCIVPYIHELAYLTQIAVATAFDEKEIAKKLKSALKSFGESG